MTVRTDPPDTSDTRRLVSVPEPVRRRLLPPMPADRGLSWIWTGVVALIAATLRLVNLRHPNQIIFDETYYADEGFSMLAHGVEWNLEEDTPKYVVHPPLGKWLIALGIRLSGFTGSEPVQEFHATGSFGWRISAVVAGVISVVLVTRIARRLFRSTLLGCTAGLLLALDGMHFVSSRVALLDIFLMLFIVAAFGCLVMDREASRRRWLQAMESGVDTTTGRPSLSLRTLPWWRLAAGIMAGCAAGVKWSAIWYIALFVVLIFLWEVGTRRAAGARRPWYDTLLDELGWIAAFCVLALLTYLATWTGWFLSDDGWYRHWRADQGLSEAPIIGALQNLWHYHWEAYQFHVGLTSEHTYQSWPWQWLLLGRPVAYYWNSDGPCGAASCAAEILLLGTPVLWWSFIPALLATLWYAISHRDWRAWTILGTSAAGILPWFLYQLDDRTMFYFYALPSVPFLVMAVTMTLGMVIGPREASPNRRFSGAIAAATYVAAVGLCFMYFYPIYTGQSIPYDEWYARMWLGQQWI